MEPVVYISLAVIVIAVAVYVRRANRRKPAPEPKPSDYPAPPAPSPEAVAEAVAANKDAIDKAIALTASERKSSDVSTSGKSASKPSSGGNPKNRLKPNRRV